MENTICNFIRHYGNSLHVYCRLVDFGFTKKIARRLSEIYENIFHGILY